VQDFPSVS